jgi:hypothetical protein
MVEKSSGAGIEHEFPVGGKKTKGEDVSEEEVAKSKKAKTEKGEESLGEEGEIDEFAVVDTWSDTNSAHGWNKRSCLYSGDKLCSVYRTNFPFLSLWLFPLLRSFKNLRTSPEAC